MLEIHLKLDAQSARSATRGKTWIAETTVNGTTHQARSHSGAAYALARVLVTAGVPDQPAQITQDGLAGHITFPSLHRMAERTITESASVSIREGKWHPHPGSNMGVDVSSPDGV